VPGATPSRWAAGPEPAPACDLDAAAGVAVADHARADEQAREEVAQRHELKRTGALAGKRPRQNLATAELFQRIAGLSMPACPS